MNTQQEVLALLDEILSLKGRTSSFTTDTPLLGAIPELDSMAVAGLLTEIEDQLDMVRRDQRIDARLDVDGLTRARELGRYDRLELGAARVGIRPERSAPPAQAASAIVKQYELWWAELPEPVGTRPVLLLSRSGAYQYLNRVLVVEVTTTSA